MQTCNVVIGTYSLFFAGENLKQNFTTLCDHHFMLSATLLFRFDTNRTNMHLLMFFEKIMLQKLQICPAHNLIGDRKPLWSRLTHLVCFYQTAVAAAATTTTPTTATMEKRDINATYVSVYVCLCVRGRVHFMIR
jgi:hypothetical protein